MTRPYAGYERIANERSRQIHEEGYDPAHDDQHDMGELALAAACYARLAGEGWPADAIAPRGWPFERCAWKPTGDAVRDLTKAGALIAAEIDRLQRASR